MDDRLALMKKRRRKLKKLLKNKRQEIIHLERLIKETSSTMHKVRVEKLDLKRIREDITKKGRRFSKRSLLRAIEEVHHVE